MARPVRVDLDGEGVWILRNTDGLWQASLADTPDVVGYVFSAPEDATKGELEAELEYLILQNEDDVSEDDDVYATTDGWGSW